MNTNLNKNITCPTKPRRNNKIIRLIKKASLKFHLDKNIWNVLLLLTVAFLVVSPFIQSDLTDKEKRKYLFDAASVVAIAGSFLWTANGIHNKYHDNQRARASDYVTSWYTKDLSQSIKCVRELANPELDQLHKIYKDKCKISDHKSDLEILILRLKYSGDPILVGELSQAQTRILEKLLADKDKDEQVDKVLEFFEQMGQDVKLKVVDHEYLKDFFYNIVIRYYELFRKYIEYWQKKLNSPTVYCNFVYLAQTWEKENDPPAIPKICRRPLVLDDKEISEIKERVNNFQELVKVGDGGD